MARLSNQLVEHIARKLADRLDELSEDVQVEGDRQAVEHHFYEAFVANFEEEKAIELEARKLIDLHLRGQSPDSIDYSDTVKRATRELAKKRGFVL